MKCPYCNKNLRTANGWARHRRRELTRWLRQCGEHAAADRIRSKPVHAFRRP